MLKRLKEWNYSKILGDLIMTDCRDEKNKSCGKESKGAGKKPLPEVNFSSFIMSLASSALVHLGQLDNPVDKTIQKNLSLAKQTIDLLMLLEAKTKGNLDHDEEKMLKALLYDLRMKYIEACK